MFDLFINHRRIDAYGNMITHSPGQYGSGFCDIYGSCDSDVDAVQL